MVERKERTEEQRRGKKPIATPNSQIDMHIMVIILQEQLVLADNLASGQPGTGGTHNRKPYTNHKTIFAQVFFPTLFKNTSAHQFSFLLSIQRNRLAKGMAQAGGRRRETRRSLRPGQCSLGGLSSRLEPGRGCHKL